MSLPRDVSTVRSRWEGRSYFAEYAWYAHVHVATVGTCFWVILLGEARAGLFCIPARWLLTVRTVEYVQYTTR